jgi:tRNA pseudouridine38-40 synthase
MKRNYKILIAYDGSRFYGWEHQPLQDTVQGRIEKAFENIMGMIPDINGAGRTDAGVHARGMVANVFLEDTYPVDELRQRLNENLPEDIRILAVKTASDNFHARYSAVGKTYRYTCHYGEHRAVFDRKYVNELEKAPDVDIMIKAAKLLEGKHDFAAFCRQPSNYVSTVRVVDRIDIVCNNGYIYFTFHGTGFMRNMVRIMVGTLLDVGYGKIPLNDINKIIESKDRKMAGHTAKAMGLCLMRVDY